MPPPSKVSMGETQGEPIICNILRSTRKKGRGRMDTYLETSSTTVSCNRRNIFQVDYEGSNTGILNASRGFGLEITSGISNNKMNHGCMTSC